MEDFFFFSSALAKYHVPADVVDRANHIIDQLHEKDSLPRAYHFQDRLYSAVNRELLFPIQLMPDFLALLQAHVAAYDEKFYTRRRKPGAAPRALKLEKIWVVSQYESEWNYLHTHSGALSGVFYLRVPENMASGLPEGDKRAIAPGKICFAEGSVGDYRRGSVEVAPRVGDLYIFPADLMHTVYLFFGAGERRSISFNFTVT